MSAIETATRTAQTPPARGTARATRTVSHGAGFWLVGYAFTVTAPGQNGAKGLGIATLAVGSISLLLLILLIVFGTPGQLPTIVGLTTAGLTVVLQDFLWRPSAGSC